MSVVDGRIGIVTPEDLIAFEARWPRHTPTKAEAIRHQLGISPARFYHLLHRVASSAEAIAADAVTARRVRERVATRAAERGRRMRAVA